MTRFLICTMPLLFAATPAFAQTSTGALVSPAVAAPAPAAAPDKPKKICRKFEVTGRRIAETECHTAEQWAEYDRNSAKNADDFVKDANKNGARASFSSSSGPLTTQSMFGIGPQ